MLFGSPCSICSGEWLVLQVADVAVGVLGIPDWTLRFILLLLGLGLPFVLFFSWAYDVTPEGIKKVSEIDRSDPAKDQTRRKLDIAVILVVLAGRWRLASGTCPAVSRRWRRHPRAGLSPRIGLGAFVINAGRCFRWWTSRTRRSPDRIYLALQKG